ncbi:dynein regulatory complex protein 11-like [Leguminivora glycinivorella]|uniref:dynein regulatory complex protein 11-like n=1 Tax=Leguminivora glycinivorella TaxID=1035111 RepID=UPI00200CD24E|nr:dynein regulatory complex protein 11-like [Leguminivora glycinivorella]
MSSNFYFEKWKTVLKQLTSLIQIDQEYQISKAHDQRRCQAAERLNGMLAAYTSIYNEVLECSQQNLQVQKTKDIYAVLYAVVDRILELKNQLRKLEGCQAQFLSKGAIRHHLTVNDAEFHDIPIRVDRNEHAKEMITDAFNAVKEKILQRELELAKEEEIAEEESIDAWWEDDNDKKDDDTTGDKFVRYDKVEELSDEQLKTREMAALIQAHEKTRRVTQINLQRMQKRHLWEKELLGTLAPHARDELKIRAAKIIQKVGRVYMELKRKKLRECKTNELLEIKPCGEFSYREIKKVKEIKDRRLAMYKQLDKAWKHQCVQIKEEYYKKNYEEMKEHYRDSIRDWFREWYEKIGLFHNIPKINQGGSVAIWRGDIPSPEDWYEQYKEYIAAKQRNKNKSSQEAKLEKKAALMEQKRLKSEENRKKKLEEQLKRKMMKNPNMHPGYNYPESKKFHELIETLGHYHELWEQLDENESMEVKQGNVKQVDEENLIAEVKLEIATQVDDDMKQELKKLNKALKKDYANALEKMPEPMPDKKKKGGKKKKVGKEKIPDDVDVAEKMEYLVENGILKEYSPTKLEDFLGDHNMVGDGCRCLDIEAHPSAGEIRSLWWERCRQVSHGLHKILVVGPAGNGRSTLVYALASVNDATLLEVDPSTFDVDLVTPEYLQTLVNALAVCARVVQPTVIYMKNVHLLFYKKKKKSIGGFPNAELIKRYLIKKLFKRFSKTDNITIIASCYEPWLTTGKLLKQFPDVLLLPDTTYQVVVQLLNDWILGNRCLPRNLDVHTLARMLRGYGFKFLKTTLEDFLTPDRIVKMAAYGLTVKEILDHVIQTGVEKHDYEQYLKWYSKKTIWGKKEAKQLEEAREFRAAVEKYAEAEEKKKHKKILTETN